MELADGIGAALSNALRIDEIQSLHIQELRRLKSLAVAASARPVAVDAAQSRLQAENASLQLRVAAQESDIGKLRHQARTLKKCASRALELLIRSRGSAAASDLDIIQLKRSLRKYGASEPGDSDHGGEKLPGAPDAAPIFASKLIEDAVAAQQDVSRGVGDRRSPSHVPPRHAKRQKSEKASPVSAAAGITHAAVLQLPTSPEQSELSVNFGAAVEDDVHVTSLPITLDDSKNGENCDELFDDHVFNGRAQPPAADAVIPPKLPVAAPVTHPTTAVRCDADPALKPLDSHWMSAQPGDRRMKFAAAVAAPAATSAVARVAWDAPCAADDFAGDAAANRGAAASLRPAPVVLRPTTNPVLLPPTVEKPQNFIQVVRGGARDKLPGHGCKQCDTFYAVLEDALPPGQALPNACDGSHHADARAAVANLRDNASRHRAAFRKQDSPEDYWSTKFRD